MSIHLLFVEDNPGDVLLLQGMLDYAYPGQYTTALAASLAEASVQLGRQAFDAVLLDLSLPDSTGLETVDRLSAAAPGVPIVVLTGLDDEEVGLETVRHGAQDYLLKGRADAWTVARAVRYAIERKRTEEALDAARRSAEQAKLTAERASQAKDHFLAVLSHELRTPLTPVLATVTMLQRECRDDVLKDHLEVVRRNVELEARLIDDLLDVTRIARGKVELNKQSVELCTIIKRAVEVCLADLSVRKLEFGVDIGPDAPYIVEADPAGLQQVFWNLLKNAIKFTPVGGCVGIRCRRDGAGFVVTEVNDSGVGIEPDVLGKIFDAFEQAERSITRQFGGLGLGLTISKAMVEMHGGTIEAHSPGKHQGATFRVRLPLRVEQPHAVAPEGSPHAAATPRPAGPLRILLVEDHGDTARIMKQMLTADGHEVETTAYLASALKLAGERTFDVMLSDLGLPDGSGLEPDADPARARIDAGGHRALGLWPADRHSAEPRCRLRRSSHQARRLRPARRGHSPVDELSRLRSPGRQPSPSGAARPGQPGQLPSDSGPGNGDWLRSVAEVPVPLAWPILPRKGGQARSEDSASQSPFPRQVAEWPLPIRRVQFSELRPAAWTDVDPKSLCACVACRGGHRPCASCWPP